MWDVNVYYVRCVSYAARENFVSLRSFTELGLKHIFDKLRISGFYTPTPFCIIPEILCINLLRS